MSSIIDKGSASESVSSDIAEDEPRKKKLRSNKNPDVDTSFLPDRDREEEENKLREELRQVLVIATAVLRYFNDNVYFRNGSWNKKRWNRNPSKLLTGTKYEFPSIPPEILIYHFIVAIGMDQAIGKLLEWKKVFTLSYLIWIVNHEVTFINFARQHNIPVFATLPRLITKGFPWIENNIGRPTYVCKRGPYNTSSLFFLWLHCHKGRSWWIPLKCCYDDISESFWNRQEEKVVHYSVLMFMTIFES